MKLIALALGIFLISGFFVGLSSCQKDTSCVASIKCVDSAGNVVGNTNLMLYALVKSADGKRIDTADLRTNGTTDADGAIKFTFKLPAIYDISATKYIGSKKFYGLSVIKLEEGQTVEKSVSMHY
ncbi:MAG: hypothetical protein WCR21_05200 [Bacteroidota bacterium]